MIGKPNCFVVMPMTDRSETVCDMYVDRACQAEFIVIRPGQVTPGPITDAIFQDLNDDSLVIAYLGNPERTESEGNRWLWNPNVMLESGYRLGLHRPIVFIREHRQYEDEPLLPFDLANLQVVELPTEQEAKQKVHRDRTVARIQEIAHAHLTATRTTAVPVRFTAPAMTMVFDGGGGKVKSASKDAAAFLGFPPGENLIGKNVVEVVDKLVSRMPPRQREAFRQEQTQLIGDLHLGGSPLASVCMVFGDEDIKSGSEIDNAHLPIVARFQAGPGVPTELDAIYLDVSDTARLDEDGVVRWGRH